MIKKLIPILLIAILCVSMPITALATDEKKMLYLTVSYDEPIIKDRLLYLALKRIGYDVNVDAMGMSGAILMANNGEKDGICTQTIGLEKTNPNLVMVPEVVGSIKFEVYGRADSAYNISSWEDLSGLRIGIQFQKPYIENHLPKDISPPIRKDTIPLLFEAMEAGECDVVIITNALPTDTSIPIYAKKVGIAEVTSTYSYLNKKYEYLVPQLAKSIASLKADGTYDKVNNQQEVVADQRKFALHISSFYTDMEREQQISEGIDSVFFESENVDLYTVSLNSNRILDDISRAKAIFSPLRASILKNIPDVIIVSDEMAMGFLENYYNRLFSNVPVIYCALNDINSDMLWSVENQVTGVDETISAFETAELMLKLFPDTKNIFVINDYIQKGRLWKSEIDSQLSPLKNRVNISHNENSSFADLLQTIKNLPPDTLILTGFYYVDGIDTMYSTKNIHTRINENASVPVFSLMDTSIGYGQLGGKYSNNEKMGQIAGQMALEVLSDKPTNEIQNISDTTYLNKWIFDYNVLEKWNISTNSLPIDSEILNRPISLYEANPTAFNLLLALIFGALAIVIALTVFMIVLGRRNKQLIKAQMSLHTAEELKEAAYSASEAKSLFLSNMSHEIRTPLNAIIGMTSIAKKMDNIDKIKGCLSTVESSSAHLLALINDVLDISKIEAGKIELHNTPFYLEDTLNSLIGVISVKAREKMQEVLVRIENDTSMLLCGDSMRLSQVIMNLVANAVKFSDKNSKILVTVHDKARAKNRILIEISVEDQGIGLTEEEITRLFQPFQQADSSFTKRYGGTGLGLAISKEIVTMMGGEIWVTSTPDKGSNFTFNVWLDLVEEPLNHPHSSISNGKQMHVLVVDDYFEARNYFCSLLKIQGVRSQMAADAKEAISIIKECEAMGDAINIILMNYYPGDDDIIQSVRQVCTEGLSPISFILMSVCDLQSQWENGKHEWFNLFLPKPTLPTALFAKLNDAFGISGGHVHPNEKEIVQYSGKHALLVEDIEINREILKAMLEPTCIAITEVTNGKEAVEIFEANPGMYDIILMDVQMPVMDGYTATRTIRGSAHPRGATIPIIAMTAYAFREDIEAAVDAKMNGHVSKPLDMSKLIFELNRFL